MKNNLVQKIKLTIRELNYIIWPSFQEVSRITVVIGLSIVALSVVILIMDFLALGFVNLILGK